MSARLLKLTLVSALAVPTAALAAPDPDRPRPAKPTAAAKENGGAPREALALARKVQRFYDRLEDFRADFVQTYTRRALSRSSESSGVLTIKKGGKVRWAYARPAEKLFVADGETLWIYEPEERQVIVDKGFSAERLSASIAFLWGKGRLTESFEVVTPDPEAHGFKQGDSLLELVPRTDRTYERLVLEVDPKSGQVRSSVVYETSGNTNRFRFTQPRINTGIPDTTFQFVPPAGVDIVHTGPS